MLQKLRGVILAPRTPPGFRPAGPPFIRRRWVDAIKHTPRAVPAVMAIAGTVIEARIVRFKV